MPRLRGQNFFPSQHPFYGLIMTGMLTAKASVTGTLIKFQNNMPARCIGNC